MRDRYIVLLTTSRIGLDGLVAEGEKVETVEQYVIRQDNAALGVVEPADPTGDRLEDVVCYNRLTQAIKAIIAEGHIKLVETLAERIAEVAMKHPMVLAATVRVEKPRAIAEAAAAGVEIERRKY